MRKFRVNIEASITEVYPDFDPFTGSRELDWAVPHATAVFEFSSQQDLYTFVQQFGALLGAQK